MAYLLILNGQRVDDLVELNPDATLTIGSSPSNHIQLAEEHVAEVHGQVYPADGAYWFQDLGSGLTCLNAQAIPNAVHDLRPHDVLSLGQTFLKFVTEPPSAGPVEVSEAEAVDMTVEIDDELEEMRTLVVTLEAQVASGAKAVVALEAQVASSAKAVAALGQDLAHGAQSVLRLEADLRKSTGELADATEHAGELRVEVGRLAAAEDELSRALSQAREELEKVRAQLEDGRAQGSQQELASTRSALEAARAALGSLGVADAAADLPRVASEDPGTLLDAAELSPEAKRQLETSLSSYVERESLRRLSGTAPVFDRAPRLGDVEDELRALRTRAADLADTLQVSGPA